MGAALCKFSDLYDWGSTISKQDSFALQAVPRKDLRTDFDRIDAIAEMLRTLDALDKKRAVFGASTHGYRRKPCLESDLTDVEQALGLPLPAEYRNWLARVGSGAGPDHGIFSPSELRAAHEEFSAIGRESCGQAGTGSAIIHAIESVAHLTASEIAGYCDVVKRNNSLQGAAILVRSLDGCLPISHQGCSGYSCLVATGPFRGKVVGQCVDMIPIGQPGIAGAIWPEGVAVRTPFGRSLERVEAGRLFGFLDWMEDWVERSANKLIA